jgi:hypothetical protein
LDRRKKNVVFLELLSFRSKKLFEFFFLPIPSLPFFFSKKKRTKRRFFGRGRFPFFRRKKGGKEGGKEGRFLRKKERRERRFFPFFVEKRTGRVNLVYVINYLS